MFNYCIYFLLIPVVLMIGLSANLINAINKYLGVWGFGLILGLILVLEIIFWKKESIKLKIILGILIGAILTVSIYAGIRIYSIRHDINYRQEKAQVTYDPNTRQVHYYTFGNNEGLKVKDSALKTRLEDKYISTHTLEQSSIDKINDKNYYGYIDTKDEFYGVTYYPEQKKLLYEYNYGTKANDAGNTFYYISNPDGSARQKIMATGFYGLCKKIHLGEFPDYLKLGNYYGNRIDDFSFSEDGQKLNYRVYHRDSRYTYDSGSDCSNKFLDDYDETSINLE